MKRLISILFLLFCLSVLHAQTGTVTVNGSNIVDSTGTPLANGTIYFVPVTNAGSPLSYRFNGKGQARSSPASANVVNGAFSLTLADTSLTSPTNVCFSVTVINNVSGQNVLGPGYGCVQPAYNTTSPNNWCSSGSCNFDNYIPRLPALPVSTFPNLTVGSVSTVAPGSAPTAAIAGNNPSYTLNLGIPTPNFSLGTMTVGTSATDFGATITQAGGNLNWLLNVKFPLAPSATDTTKLPLAGGTLTGPLTAPGFTGPLTGTASGNLPLTGGTLTGPITITPPGSQTGRTFATPLSGATMTDSSALATSGAAQGDTHLAPFMSGIIQENTPNDDAMYLNFNCNYTGTGATGNCIPAFFVAGNTAGDTHSGIWGGNAIVAEHANTSSFGWETNTFNFNQNGDILPNGNYTAGPFLGVAATAASGTGYYTQQAAFLADDDNVGGTGGGWDYDFLGAAANDGVLLCGLPLNGGLIGTCVAHSALGLSTSSQNFSSTPDQDNVTIWTGSTNGNHAVISRSVPRSGANAVFCKTFTFDSTLGFEACSDGSITSFGQSNSSVTSTGIGGSFSAVNGSNSIQISSAGSSPGPQNWVNAGIVESIGNYVDDAYGAGSIHYFQVNRNTLGTLNSTSLTWTVPQSDPMHQLSSGVPTGTTSPCSIGATDQNTAATSASTVLYVCYPANTWTAITVP
ncbi:MAG: hypothetical protein WA419_12655 [Silvibacterium sp.]